MIKFFKNEMKQKLTISLNLHNDVSRSQKHSGYLAEMSTSPLVMLDVLPYWELLKSEAKPSSCTKSLRRLQPSGNV